VSVAFVTFVHEDVAECADRVREDDDSVEHDENVEEHFVVGLGIHVPVAHSRNCLYYEVEGQQHLLHGRKRLHFVIVVETLVFFCRVAILDYDQPNAAEHEGERHD
jgi:hypothetical protein